MIDQEEIHTQCLSNDPKERIHALEQLQIFFSSMPDKQQAWNDLHILTSDEHSSVRYNSASALCSAFSQVPYKQQAWNDLHRLTRDQDNSVRSSAVKALVSSFSQVPDKQQAWNDLIRLINDKDWNVRYSAASALGSAFSQVPDKQQAWNELHKLTNDEHSSVRYSAATALCSAFSQVPDKQQAWNDLHKLTNDIDWNVRYRVAKVLGSSFSQIPDKLQAWNDLHRLTNDEEWNVRSKAASSLGSTFSQLPDKEQAWNDLHRLTNDGQWNVRYRAASALVSAFFQRSYKEQAWNDLHRLTNDGQWNVRYSAATALGSSFSQIPDKLQAWNDLHRLTNDEDIVRSSAASALGSAYSQLPDKHQAWNDLIRLTNDEKDYVRTCSNHSLGRVSIFKASQANKEEDYKKELEMAIEYFDIAAQESPERWLNPSQFCLPFYRTFHYIIFEKQKANEETEKCLAEVKDAIEGSKSKKLLFEAVENLANALKEVQNLENTDLQTMQGELNFYRKYCDRAEALMREAEDETPFAIIAMKKGLPILDKNIRELLEEIQKKTEVIREQTKGTQLEELCDELSISGQFLLQVRDPVGFKKQVNNMQNTLKAICSKLPEGQKGEACELLKVMYAEPLIEDKIPLMVNILSKFSYQLDMTVYLNRIEEKSDKILENIRFDIFKIKLNSYNVISNLDAIKRELEKLNEMEDLNKLSFEKLDSIQAEKLNDLNREMLSRLDEIKIIIDALPKNDDTQKIFDFLNELRQSDSDMLLQRSSAIVTFIGFVMQILSQV